MWEQASFSVACVCACVCACVLSGVSVQYRYGGSNIHLNAVGVLCPKLQPRLICQNIVSTLQCAGKICLIINNRHMRSC